MSENEIMDFILENEDNPNLDSHLLSILDKDTTEAERKMGKMAFRRFEERVGMSRMAGARRAGSILLRIAATLVVPMILFGAHYYRRAQQASLPWISEATGFSETRTVTLSDGTTVKLQSCSQILYPQKFFGKQRSVFLVGEAYICATHDPSHPLVVSAGDMKITVHGTRFNVNSYVDNVEDEVALMEGSVEVGFSDREGSIFLKPGEMVKFDRANRQSTIKSFALNYYEHVLSSEGLQFSNATLRDIASALGRKFNLEIVIKDQETADERYFASFVNGEGVDEILSALNTEGHLEIERSGSVITIASKTRR